MIVTKDAPISVVDSEPEPDIAVVMGTDDDFADAHPNTALLTMEIAVTSEEIDREKANIYAEAAVPEFWLVLAVEKIIEVHTCPRDGVYTTRAIYQAGDTVTSTVLPLLQIPWREIFPT
jgi:Uma2 family endonuclease